MGSLQLQGRVLQMVACFPGGGGEECCQAGHLIASMEHLLCTAHDAGFLLHPTAGLQNDHVIHMVKSKQPQGSVAG